jgi:Tol biopolymer transport system component
MTYHCSVGLTAAHMRFGMKFENMSPQSCLVVLLIIAFSHRASAATLVYMYAPDGSGPWPIQDIGSMNDDGSNVKALTNDGHSHNPIWSPDGRHILFIHDSALTNPPPYREAKGFESYHSVELYLMDADGRNPHLLRRIEPVIESAAWSPDGKTLAIICVPDGGPMRASLYLLPANGLGQLRLLVPNAGTPAWSPDGKRLAFSVEQPRGEWAIHVANADGSHDVQLTNPSLIAGSPAWSPDGKLIAFDEFVNQRQQQQIFVMGADGSRARQITTDPNWSCGHPSWSPNGERLAFHCRSSAPCGGVSDVGTIQPQCDRRIFVGSQQDTNSKLAPLHQHDGAAPEFAPITE